MGVVSAAIGAGAALVGGAMANKASKDAAEDAADAQKYSADAASQVQWDMYNRARDDFSPFRETGQKAIPGLEQFKPSEKTLNYLMQMEGYSPLDKLGPVEFDPNDPIYQWKQRKGEEAVNRAYAARGMHDSRPAVNSLMDFNMALSADEADKQYGRSLDKYSMLMDEYNRLGGLFGAYGNLDNQEYSRLLDRVKIGAGSASATGNAAMQTGTNLGNIQTNLGNSLARNYMQQGANQANFYSQLGAMPLNLMNAYNMQNIASSPTTTPHTGSTPYFNAVSSYGGYTPRYQ